MSNIIHGGDLRDILVANYNMRQATWQEQILINNEKGQIINNSGALKYDDIKQLTETVKQIQDFSSVGSLYRKIKGAGMSVSMPINKTLIDFHDVSDMGDAEISMDAANRHSEQNNYDQKLVPLPIIHKDFTVPFRQEEFSYKLTDGSRRAAFKVMETRDRMLMNGAPNIIVNGTPLYGLTNHPNTIKETGIIDLANPSNATSVYQAFVEFVKRMFLDAKVDMPNSIQVFVANDVYSSMQYKSSDTKSNDLTIMQDVMNISQIKAIDPHQDLPDGAVMMYMESPLVFDLPEAMDITTVPWQKLSQIEPTKFTSMAACTLRIMPDRKGTLAMLYATK